VVGDSFGSFFYFGENGRGGVYDDHSASVIARRVYTSTVDSILYYVSF